MTPEPARRAVLRRFVAAVDGLSEHTGRLVAWLVLALVLVVVYDVVMRYLFAAGSVALQELEWHLFSIIFLLGAAYTLKQDGHVRVDVLYHSQRLGDRHRAWINLLGSLLLLAPFCLVVILASWPFVHDAFVHGEGSPDPGGLPHRWLLKAAIPLGFALLLLQGLAEAARNLLRLLERR